MAKFPQSGFGVLLNKEPHTQAYLVAATEEEAIVCVAYGTGVALSEWRVFYANDHQRDAMLTGLFATALCAFFSIRYMSLGEIIVAAPAALHARACKEALRNGRKLPPVPCSMTGNGVLATFVRGAITQKERTNLVRLWPRLVSDD